MVVGLSPAQLAEFSFLNWVNCDQFLELGFPSLVGRDLRTCLRQSIASRTKRFGSRFNALWVYSVVGLQRDRTCRVEARHRARALAAAILLVGEDRPEPIASYRRKTPK
ncbi:hypothetical protein Pla22_19440 [Rubripirellula amarantea]|uniref:Uncharacterized protein n=1 Tax=Rubripirellula amarantea TaxID=2527999 RepID=A0A5C5WWR3_9BACT|nr:hypothetical protein Pla22_19440 [Rubripirellula amarantea]